MKKTFMLNSKMLTRLFYLSIIIFLLSPQEYNSWLDGQAAAQSESEFKFNPVSEWEQTEAKNVYIVNGTHKLIGEHYIWIFLRDRYNNFYLQYPPVDLFDDNTWEAMNISIGKGIRDIWGIQVNKEGHQHLQKMADNGEWGAIKKSEIEKLPGYRKLTSLKLTSIPIQTSSPATPTPKLTTTSEPEKLLIADFNTGKDPINYGGKLQLWNSGDLLEVETGYYKLDDNEKHREYAAFVTLTEPKKKGKDDWAGGGLVLVFKGDELAIDLSDYQFLEFDVKIQPGSRLENTRVKLESPPKDVYIERLLSEYGVILSTEWQTVRIPLEHFATFQPSDDPSFQKLPDLKAVTKFVTVSVLNEQAQNTQGTLLLDNIQFIK